jgi:serine/threonine protein kinase
MDLYEVVKSIGSGNFGQVYLVRHKLDGRNYVVKKIKTRDMPETEKEKTEQEVRLLQKLRHANIVAYKDSYIDRDQFLCIVMVNCEGGDMYSKIKSVKGKKFTEAQILEWLAQILLALLYLHERRILHRDLKTQNIFLKNSKIRLGDFGIAKVLDGTRDFANTCIGTPYYMSPELFKNKPYSYKSDVWGLGCVIYEMCNLRHAFDAQSLNGLAMKIMKGAYPPTTPFYSKGLRDLISRMLIVNPAQRPSLVEILNTPFVRRHVVLYLREYFNPSTECQDLDDLNIDSLKDQAERYGLMPLINGESKLPQSIVPQGVLKNPQIIEAKLKKEEAEKQQMEEELNKLATLQNEIKKKAIVVKEKKSQIDIKANDLEKAQKQKMLEAEKRREKYIQEKKKKAHVYVKKTQDNEESKDESTEEAFSARERVLQFKEKKKKEEEDKIVAQLRKIHHENVQNRKEAIKKQVDQFRTSSILQSMLRQKELDLNADEEDEEIQMELNGIEEIDDESEDEIKDCNKELVEIEQKKSHILEKINEKTIKIDELRESLKFIQVANNILPEEYDEDYGYEVETPLPGLLDSVEELAEEEELKEEPPSWQTKIRDRIKLLRQ